MLRKPDIQYIDKFFIPGAAAPQIQKREDKKRWVTTVQPKKPQKPKLKILVDPVALCALVVAAAMIALMQVGIFQFKAACDEREQVRNYLTQLQNENAQLNHTYYANVDLENIRNQALALGMIPIEEAQVIHISVELPEPEPEPSFWDDVVWFFSGLFA